MTIPQFNREDVGRKRGVIPQFRVFMADDVDDYVSPVLKSGYISQGPKVEEFERALKDYVVPNDFLLTVNSGTSALMLSLHLAGVKPGTNVVSTPMTCSATNEAIALMGAEIIWADVDEYGNILPDDVLKKINSRTAAVMAVDWGGLPCDFEGLHWATSQGEKKIPVVEDAAHAFGALYQNEFIGGDFRAYSFQAIKHLTTGDGGLVVCPDQESYERGKLLRWFGLDRTSSDAMRSRQDIKEVGYKFHMNDINASIGLANLPHVKGLIEKARHNAAYYDQYLSDYRPDWPTDRLSSYWLYTIHVKFPQSFEKWMQTQGITVSQVHSRNDEYTAFWRYKGRQLPRLDEFFQTMVCLPVGWWVSEDDMNWVIDCVREWSNA